MQQRWIGSGRPVPYIDINPHPQRPKWLAYVVLAILAILTAVVVYLSFAPT